MQPRLKTSKKWSPLPKELIQQIRSVFSQGFQEHTKGGKIEVNGRIYPEEILIRVGYRELGALKQSNWEISIAYRKDKDNVLKLLHLAVDAIGALFEQFFGSEHDHDFPRIWEEVDFENRAIYVQYTTHNSELEAAADKILGVSGESDEVAQGEWDADVDPEQIKASLGLSSDDEDELEKSESPSVEKAPEKSPAPKKKPTHH